MGRTRRGLVTAALAAGVVLLGGCAEPGQLGSSVPSPAPAAQAAPAPAPAEGTRLLGTGLVAEPVEVRTPGPAVYTVRTEVLAPGESTGWHAHPGTELSVVTAGRVTLVREGACDPVSHGEGDAAFVADAVPHEMRNEGTAPATLVAASLLAPGAPARRDAPPACE